MSSKKIIFTDAAGMPWSFTVLPEGKTRFILEPVLTIGKGILIAAEKAVLTLDESSNAVPFALELDDNCTVTLTNKSLELLDEFLQQADELVEVAA